MSTHRLPVTTMALTLWLALMVTPALAHRLEDVSGSTVNTVTPNPVIPGAPFDLCFNVTYDSPDYEYLFRFDVNLPDGWTVNTVMSTPSNVGGSTVEGTEAGNVVYWQSSYDWGAWDIGDFDFCANVTVPDDIGAPWGLDWNMTGEGYGDPPHSTSGAITLKGAPLAPHLALTKSVTPAADAPYQGAVIYTVILRNTGVLSDASVLLTDTLPAAVDFGAWLIDPGASVTSDEITWNGALASGAAITFSFTATHTGGYSDFVANTAEFSGTQQTGSAAAYFTVEPQAGAPVLAPIGSQTLDELSALTFTATATDTTHTVLTYSLEAGSVGSITPAGAFTWAPTEADGPGEYIAAVRVTNGEWDDLEIVNITVIDVNSAPDLAPIGDQVVDEMDTLVFTATATDGDLPVQLLIYTLDTGSVGRITPDGVFDWPTTEADGPGVYTATVRVSDSPASGSGQAMSDTETISITVAEMNTAPRLWPIGARKADKLKQLRFAARVSDDDLPTQPLTFTLDAGSVGSIGTRTGLFTWTPGDAQLPETYTATVRVSDGEFVDAETFTLTVNVDTPGIGQWVLVNNASAGPDGNPPPFNVSNFRIVDPTDNAVYGPFLDGQLGSVGGGRFDVAVTPDGRTALISNFGDSTVYLVNMTNPLSPSVITSVTIPFFAEDMDVSPDGRYALVTDGGFSTRVATIDIPSATLVYTAVLGIPQAQAVAIAPDNTVIVADYWNHAIHTLRLDENGAVTWANTYTYTYPGYAITDTGGLPQPVNIGIAPDGQTVIVCDALTSTVGTYKIVAPGVLSFAGLVTGLHGTNYEFFVKDPATGETAHPGVQSIAFNAAGDKAYAVINNMMTAGTTITNPEINSGDRLGVLNIAGPGQVSLEAGGVVTLPHYTGSQLFGVDTLVVAGDKVFVSYPSLSGAIDLETLQTSLAVVDLTDYSLTTTMVLSGEVSVPAGVAALPLRLDLHLAVSDPAPVAGQIVTYTLSLYNAGPQFTGITLREVLSPEVEFVGPITLFPPTAGVVGSAPPELVTNLALSALQQVTVTFPVRVGNVPPGTLVRNEAEAAGPELATPARTQRTFTVTTAILTTFDLTAAPSVLLANGITTSTLHVVARDQSGSGAPFAGEMVTLSWTLGYDPSPVTVTLDAQGVATATYTAGVTPGVDGLTAVIHNGLQTFTATTSITLTDNPLQGRLSSQAGNVITYTFIVSNASATDDQTNVVISGSIPAGTQLIAVTGGVSVTSGGDYGAGYVTTPAIPALTPGERYTLTWSVRPLSYAGDIVNIAHASSDTAVLRLALTDRVYRVFLILARKA
jgi:uncharacterized repeat protein (TIGR01451 family)